MENRNMNKYNVGESVLTILEQTPFEIKKVVEHTIGKYHRVYFYVLSNGKIIDERDIVGKQLQLFTDSET